MDGEIRKVIVGDIKNGMSYQVGQSFSQVGVIAEIFIDNDFYDAYGHWKVCVSVEYNGTVEDWKRFPLETCNLEYELG